MLERRVTFFECEQSWVVQDAISPELLMHEQGIFNIAELYGRKMRVHIALFVQKRQQYLSLQEFMLELKAVYRVMINEIFEQIQVYNAQTLKGTDFKMQAEWNLYLSGELDKLNQFSRIKH